MPHQEKPSEFSESAVDLFRSSGGQVLDLLARDGQVALYKQIKKDLLKIFQLFIMS
jgi:hypothetical protein